MKSSLPLLSHPFRHPRWWALGFLGLCLGHALSVLLPIPWFSLLPIAGLWLGLAARLGWGAPRHARYRRVWPWSLLPLALWWVYLYLSHGFGIVDLGAVFFHLQAGISEHGGAGRITAAILYTLAGLLSLAAFTWLIRTDRRWRLWEKVLMLALVAGNPLLFGLGQRGAAIVVEDDGAWLDRRYQQPVLQGRPASPPNLLVIYLESLERTYADRERFGDAYADLDRLGARGSVFAGVRQLDNTGWTMAGMIASQCGVPLMPAGLLHDRQFEPLEAVAPGVDCLGDLLSEEGYRLTYLGGASTDFAGKGLFYEGHGFDRVLGREALTPRLTDPDYLNSWGLYDDTLFDIAMQEIDALEAEPGPWGLVMLTLGSHAPNGYPSRRCRERQGEFDGVDILYSVECTAWLTRDFLERLEARGLLDDTLVMIASDHLSMRVSAWDQLVLGERDNTFMLLGPGVEATRIERQASTLDLYPTLLEAMGYDLPQHRAGLGVSLLAPTLNLVERHGVEEINRRLTQERALQQRLWEGLAPRPRAQGDEDAASGGVEQVTEMPRDKPAGEMPPL
ncbi:sulfatase-like hydrolase/transferase [Halomonas pacifica]|uniref:sulfatase-like hydrolase/transferase n=1 Tax=Bisbaumannia pacifica TaxID=77098 RepID=UPI001E60C3F5|nr:sulfatase-like hydrolase/transferase [Halomonas pacifica]MDC8804671.1 sulfatase-like hydrolase/transferase [Halomonas pacifica]